MEEAKEENSDQIIQIICLHTFRNNWRKKELKVKKLISNIII